MTRLFIEQPLASPGSAQHVAIDSSLVFLHPNQWQLLVITGESATEYCLKEILFLFYKTKYQKKNWIKWENIICPPNKYKTPNILLILDDYLIGVINSDDQ